MVAQGASGSLGFVDLQASIGYAYLTGPAGTAFTGEPRDHAPQNTLYAIIPAA